MSEEIQSYNYRPITRSEFELPEDYQIAVWIVINMEYFEYETPYPADGDKSVPNVMTYSWREYGSRVGIWRILKILDKYGVKPMVALNSSICDHMPEIVEALVEMEVEIIGHGITNSQRLKGLSPEEERLVIKGCKDRIEESTGNFPRGWLGPGLSENFSTIDTLIQEEFDYVCDWCNDDHPYFFETGSGNIMSMPYSGEINDVSLFTKKNLTGEQFQKTIMDQFEVLYEEGNKLMPIAIHPYITGQAFRSKYLEGIIREIKNKEGVWWPSCGEICDYYKEFRTN
jgi:peptidoglycan/xylan/chitin deacetylase (PgdA/CDA1 family)